jgi:DNA-binding transcriptional LysR family regulator
MQQKLSHLISRLSMHDLRRLRAFRAVAERRSFSEAALALGYAQSVVSHHVAALEQEFGLTLVDRATRPVGLTEAGERLREHAEIVLGQVATAEEELRSIAGLLTGTVRVGAFLTACTSFVPPALARFERAHPGVKIELEQLERGEAVRRLRGGELDVAVIWDEFEEADADERRAADGLESHLLGHDPYRIVLPAGHPLARRRELSLADLATERFNGPSVDTSGRYRAMLDRLCAEAGFTPDVAYVVRDVTVGRAFVAAGVCVGLMPELAIQEPRPDVAVVPVRDLDPVRPVYATWLRGRRMPSIPAVVKELARAATARLGDEG